MKGLSINKNKLTRDRFEGKRLMKDPAGATHQDDGIVCLDKLCIS